jgi:hypothetical protein
LKAHFFAPHAHNSDKALLPLDVVYSHGFVLWHPLKIDLIEESGSQYVAVYNAQIPKRQQYVLDAFLLHMQDQIAHQKKLDFFYVCNTFFSVSDRSMEC